MKVAIIGSRTIRTIDSIEKYLPEDMTELISGGAIGVDSIAESWADSKGLKKTIFLPEYDKYNSRATLVRNIQIVNAADMVVAFWNGNSNGTMYTLDAARKQKKPVAIVTILPNQPYQYYTGEDAYRLIMKTFHSNN